MYRATFLVGFHQMPYVLVDILAFAAIVEPAHIIFLEVPSQLCNRMVVRAGVRANLHDPESIRIFISQKW